MSLIEKGFLRGRHQFAAAVVVLLLLVSPAFGANILEVQVKAAFLYNFTNFVEWPEQAWQKSDDPIIISVVGNEAFAAVLEKTVAGRKAQGRSFQVRRYPAWPGWIAPIRVSHLLYIENSSAGDPQKIAMDLGGTPVLIVGNGPEFARRGGMIQFLRQGDRIVFEINRRAAEASGLRISSRLYQVAKIIEDLPGGSR